MINRILIRLKVVQILYSYLLSRNEFKIDPAPENASRDRRFAYSVYLDMLLLIQELSGIRSNAGMGIVTAAEPDRKLAANRVGRALANDPVLKEITARNSADLKLIAPVLPQLRKEILASAAYADYAKRRSRELDDDVKFWTVILETTVLKNTALTQALRASEDFSLTGLHHGIYAVIDTLRSYNDSRAALRKAKQDLRISLDKAHELYFDLFALIIGITDEQAFRIEHAKTKYLASSEDLNPDLRLVDNRLARYLAECAPLNEYLEKKPADWAEQTGLLEGLLDLILESETYREYLSRPADSINWRSDCEFWREVMLRVVLPSDLLAEALENKSIYWNDDLNSIGTFFLKSLRRLGQASAPEEYDSVFLPQYKDEEDAAFGDRLFDFAVAGREQYRQDIDRFINPDWDPERLAFMDIVIMVTALAEIVNFPAIPVPVSLNEYVEIANTYSTAKSGAFVNGILYSVVNEMVDNGIIHKPMTSPAAAARAERARQDGDEQ